MSASTTSAGPDFSRFSCPVPLRDYPEVILGHGGGGMLSRELIDHVFLPAFHNPLLDRLGDSTVLELDGRLDRGSGGERHGE
jgi:hydrogenase expression/formation protein HypE